MLKGQKNKLLSDEPILTDECHKQLEELQEIRLSNERKINELGQLYSKSVRRHIIWSLGIPFQKSFFFSTDTEPIVYAPNAIE